jgi:hypothetical protein
MPTWPPVPGRRTITCDMLPQQVQHLDTQADFDGCSRAAYLRRLVIRDRDSKSAPRLNGAAVSDLAGAATCAFELREELIVHLDHRAAQLHCSRSAVLRNLIIHDIRRQGPAMSA